MIVEHQKTTKIWPNLIDKNVEWWLVVGFVPWFTFCQDEEMRETERREWKIEVRNRERIRERGKKMRMRRDYNYYYYFIILTCDIHKWVGKIFS